MEIPKKRMSVENIEGLDDHLSHEASELYQRLERERDELDNAKLRLNSGDLRDLLQRRWDSASQGMLDAQKDVKLFSTSINRLLSSYPSLRAYYNYRKENPRGTDPPKTFFPRGRRKAELDASLGVLNCYEDIRRLFEGHLEYLQAVGKEKRISLGEKKPTASLETPVQESSKSRDERLREKLSFTVPDAADIADQSDKTIRKRIDEGMLKKNPQGRITRESLASYLGIEL